MEDGKNLEILKSYPYTLTRTKYLPHYYFILDGVDKSIMQKNVKITTDCLSFCNGDIICANIWEKPNVKILNYDNELPIIHIDQLKPYLTTKVLDKIFNCNVESSKINKPKLISNIILKMDDNNIINGNVDDLKLIISYI